MNKLYNEALIFAMIAHQGQTRKNSGQPYIVHPVAVAKLVSERTDDPEMIAAALLHDTIEDTVVTYEDLYLKFGPRIADLVEELTNEFTTDKYPDLNRAERKAREAVRLSNISDDAKLIKACDIADNTKDVDQLDPDFAELYVSEKSAVLDAIGYDRTVMEWSVE